MGLELSLSLVVGHEHAMDGVSLPAPSDKVAPELN